MLRDLDTCRRALNQFYNFNKVGWHVRPFYSPLMALAKRRVGGLSELYLFYRITLIPPSRATPIETIL